MTSRYHHALSRRRPLLRGPVDVDDAEAHVVSVRPLEVVEQRPLEVAAHVHAFVDRRPERPQVGVEVADATHVMDGPVVDRVVVGHAVLGDVRPAAGRGRWP